MLRSYVDIAAASPVVAARVCVCLRCTHAFQSKARRSFPQYQSRIIQLRMYGMHLASGVQEVA